jgi:hypothetical protein
MADTSEQISALLHEAGETHHRVFRIVDGADDDWASWYAQWLIELSELPDLLGARPVRSELIYLLVSLDKQYTAQAPGEPWEIYYARQILRHFQPSGTDTYRRAARTAQRSADIRSCRRAPSQGPATAVRVPRPVRPVRMRVSGCYQIIGEVTGRRPGRGRIHHDIRR